MYSSPARSRGTRPLPSPLFRLGIGGQRGASDDVFDTEIGESCGRTSFARGELGNNGRRAVAAPSSPVSTPERYTYRNLAEYRHSFDDDCTPPPVGMSGAVTVVTAICLVTTWNGVL